MPSRAAAARPRARREPGRAARRLLRAAWRRAPTFVRRRLVPSGAFVLLSLVLLAAGLTAVSLRAPDHVPLTALMLVVFLGGFLLTVRSLLLLLLAVAALVGVVVADHDVSNDPVPATVVLLAATAVLTVVISRSRARLGVHGTRGETMLVDLRDRLRAQGSLPDLPAGWSAEVAMSSANGASFSGDFIVATRAPGTDIVEVVLVDVSGNGVDAGTRALLLSGAFGGLLGAMPSGEFLAAANSYLLRQHWPEGFATAVHLVLDLSSGAYVVSSAGHPPTAQFLAGSGRWTTKETTKGPLLGIIDGATYVGQQGRLDRGDAMLLYTDGLIEVPGRDLSVGIDRLLGEAERLVTRGFRGGARKLVDAVATGVSDDRALMLLWRS